MKSAPVELSPDLIAEIERHKYFLSEKAGYDVGWEFAEQDWMSNFANGAGDSRKQPSTVPRPKGFGGLVRRMLSKTTAR